MVHHIVTITLIVFSLSTKCHQVGIVVIFLHDICDVFLATSKTLFYLKKQGKRTVLVLERLAEFCFACFAVTWFVARLYWFPLRVIFFTSVVVEQMQLTNIPYSLLFNILLYVLLAMNIYWFLFTLYLLYEIMTGQKHDEKWDSIDDSEECESKEKTQILSDTTERHRRLSIDSSNRCGYSEIVIRQRKLDQQLITSAQVLDGHSDWAFKMIDSK